MASVGRLQPLRKIVFSPTTRTVCLQQVRHSQYNPLYLDPTFRKEDLVEPVAEDDARRFRPIKAATAEQTTSLNYDPIVCKFIRKLLKEGRKDRARIIMDKTFESIKLIQLEKYHKAETDQDREAIELNPRTIFLQAVENCKPLLITQRVTRGGVVYQVPIPVKPTYQLHVAMKNLIESANQKERYVRIWDKLAGELLDAARNQGRSIKRKQDLHQLCENNRAYAHFRW